MVQGALGAAGVRRVCYGLEVGRSMRTAGGAGHIVSPRAQLVYCYFGRNECMYVIWSMGKMRSCIFFSNIFV